MNNRFRFLYVNVFVWFCSISAWAQVDTTTIKVLDFQLCKDVIEREPYELVSSYSLMDQKAWIFARIYNENGLKTFEFKWYHEDELIAEVPIKVGNSSNWRTYSNVNLKAGYWRVELTDTLGNIYKEVRFNVSGN